MSSHNHKNELRERIRNHMGEDPAMLAIVSANFESYDQANLYLALEDYITTGSREASTHGISGTRDALACLVALGAQVRDCPCAVREGPIEFGTMDMDEYGCVHYAKRALYLIRDQQPLTVVLRESFDPGNGEPTATIDALASSRKVAENFIALIRQAIQRKNVFRGKVLSFSGSGDNGFRFVNLPATPREKIILPEGLLARIERQTVNAGLYSDALRKAGRKLRRGILLHGVPGTGKTLTAMYIASAMKGRTILTLSAQRVGLVALCCRTARLLQPSVVIIEDADLIGQARENSSSLPQLFELMNHMDGLGDDADILFILTTNRPGVLEPALAARPGRIDQAYEVPLPDADCRRRLFELYGAGLKVEVKDLERFINCTNGCSGAFICELLRKAALFAAPEGEPICVTDKHLDEAMHELIVAGGKLTKSLLGSYDIGFVA